MKRIPVNDNHSGGAQARVALFAVALAGHAAPLRVLVDRLRNPVSSR